MFYKLLLLINFLSVLSVNLVVDSDVKVDMRVPGQVEAGEQMTVNVTLDKADLRSFARFQQKLPGGLEAEVIEDGQAEFRFEDQAVKFIWLRLPAEDEISLSYRISINERLKGSFELEGDFSYIEDNQRKSVRAPSNSITINPSPSVKAEMLVDVGEFKPLAKTPSEREPLRRVRCIRQKPYQAEGNGDYVVNLLVNKANKKKFAKIQEQIPAGYKAIEEEGKGAIFTFKDQTAKFLWMNLPSEPFFVISYRLVPVDGAKDPDIQGKFSYIEDDNTRNIDIVEREVNLKDTRKEHLQSIIRSQSAPMITSREALELNDNELQDQGTSQSRTSRTSASSKGKVRIEIAEEARKIWEKNARLTHKLEPQSGIYYRVQIAAGHRPINVERYFDQYDIKKEVRAELHDGWRKYSVGSFPVYKEARDYRVHVWNTTTIDDAFVAAYNNGNRITVQEALMITNHKWYK
jgi:hypothetical protein